MSSATTYMNLLKMIVMPLVLVMMIAAVVRMREVAALGKIGGMVIVILIGTTMVAAFVGILMANVFGLTAEGLTEGARELARVDVLQARQAEHGGPRPCRHAHSVYTEQYLSRPDRCEAHIGYCRRNFRHPVRHCRAARWQG